MDVFMKDTFLKFQNSNVGNGKIVVISIFECEEHESLEGVKINLYKISGLAPVLIQSKITDYEGKVIFEGIENGCYRIIEIVDKRYFDKPKYIKWNEFTIDDLNKEQKIVVINKNKLPIH
jgi:uncharacterized surface anchored protein